MFRDDKLYLEDIELSIKKVLKYVRGMDFADFEEDGKTVDAVIRNLEIIGEAAKNISDGFMEKHSHVPWSQIIGMRNKVVHEYFGVDLEILWKTIKEDLPWLKDALKNIHN